MSLLQIGRNIWHWNRHYVTAHRSISCRNYSSQQHGSVLVLSNMYPQPSASAAGVRTSYILRQLCRDSKWTSVHYATGAKKESSKEVEDLQQRYGVTFHSVPPNQSQKMKELIEQIDDISLVLFDRFYAEEAYSFHFYNHCPDAVRVLDMQDMHSLRQGRQALVQNYNDEDPDPNNIGDPLGCLPDVVQYRPTYNEPLLMRELSSLHRSDLVLVCSPHEYNLLHNDYQLPPSKLCLASFWANPLNNKPHQPSFEKRRDFCFLGGFRHAPNVDAVQQLAQHIWPRIRAELPDARLHVYGAHAPSHSSQLHNESNGLFIHGSAPDLSEALSHKRVLLAPLRFGAGIKGKIIDAWSHGMPVVTTPVGSEGMMMMDDHITSHGCWGGVIASCVDDFVRGAVQLYSDRSMWEADQYHAQSHLACLYNEDHWTAVADAIHQAVENRDERRSLDYTGAMLWHQSARSTEFFSRWIECKEATENSKRDAGAGVQQE